MKVLVTGGGGFLGSAIVKQLLERGDHPIVLGRQDYPHIKKLGVTILQEDIAHANALTHATKGIDAIIHSAGKVGVWGDYASFYNTNVIGTQNIIRSCRQNSIQYLVYTSSPSVVFQGKDICGGDESLPYATHYLSPYPKTKMLAEQAVLAANNEQLKTTVLRPHFIWGPGDRQLIPRLISRAKAGKLTLMKGPDHQVDTIYIDDAAYAHLLALDCLYRTGINAGKVYFISQDQPIAFNLFINSVLAAAHLPPVHRYMSPNLAYAIGMVFESIYSILQIKKEPLMTRFIAQHLSTSHWFNISRAKQDLQYQPKLSIEEGLIKLAEWFKQEGLSE